MQFTVQICCRMIFTLVILTTGVCAIPSSDVIQIPPTEYYQSRRLSESYHSKQQRPYVYSIQGASETFVKVPSLTMAFSHAQPLLYKIRFEGKCHSPHSRPIWLYLHLMIDDYLLYVDKFFPNTADRYKYNPGYGNNDGSDFFGALYWHSNMATVTTCAFSDIIYLKPGLHVIDVGVRGGLNSAMGVFPTYMHGGVLTIELIEYNLNADIGITPTNVTTPK